MLRGHVKKLHFYHIAVFKIRNERNRWTLTKRVSKYTLHISYLSVRHEGNAKQVFKTHFWPPDPREDIIPLRQNGLRNGNIPHVQSQLAHMGPRGVAGSQRCSLWPLLIAESSMFKDHHTSTPNALPHDNFKVGYHITSHSPSHSTHMHLHMTMLRVTLITSHPRRKNTIHWGHCNLTRQSLVRLLQIVHLSWVFIPSPDPFPKENGSKPSGPIPVPKKRAETQKQPRKSNMFFFPTQETENKLRSVTTQPQQTCKQVP